MTMYDLRRYCDILFTDDHQLDMMLLTAPGGWFVINEYCKIPGTDSASPDEKPETKLLD